MNANDKRDYAVGYGKPPHHSQFRKGQSGNPKGRPKGRRNFATALRLALDETVTVSERGKTTRIKKLDCALRQQANKAAAGDVKALTLIAQLIREWLGEEPYQEPLTIVISEDDSKL
jgi:hypothetical protein